MANTGEGPVTPERVAGTDFNEWGARTQAPTTTPNRHVAGAVAEATAKVLARYRRAEEKPRNWQLVKERLVAECGRESFAEVARYELPRGRDTIRGPSIRFAEAAVRIAGNIEIECEISHEDDQYRYLEIRAVDMETNVSFPAPVAIPKTVERKNAKGRRVLGQRTNADGDVVFIVEANEGEIFLETQRNLSRAMRTCGLRLIPGDIVDAAALKVRETLSAKDARDPKAQLNKLVDAFGQLGVYKKDLKRFLGHDMKTVAAAELERLRGVYTALTEGMEWADVCEAAGVTIQQEEPAAEGLRMRPGQTTRTSVAATAVGGVAAGPDGVTPNTEPAGAHVFELEEPAAEPPVVSCAICTVDAIRTTMAQTPEGYVCRPCEKQATAASAQPAAPTATPCAGCGDPLDPDETYTSTQGEPVCSGCLLEGARAAVGDED